MTLPYHTHSYIFQEQPGMYVCTLLFQQQRMSATIFIVKFYPSKNVCILNLEFFWKIFTKEKNYTLYRGMKDL